MKKQQHKQDMNYRNKQITEEKKKLYEKNVTTINVMPNEGEFKSEKDM